MAGESSGHTAWQPPAATSGVPVTDSLAGYCDLREIGVGGDSVVYRAKENSLGRDVAIKVLNVSDEGRAARFAREVEITLDLGRQHPNIVTVLATGITGSGRPAIVMEFYPGGTLHDRLKQLGPLPVEEVVRIGLVLADALSFAHDRGVLHRDVKPQNVLVLPTSWVLADFGIARLVDSEHTSSVETFTYRHASPQVLDGHAPTAADDIWSLGSTLYTLVDGRPPFASHDPDDDSALAYLRRVRTEEHRPLLAHGAEALAELVSRCLAKDIDDRWSSAAELHDALLGLRHRAWEPSGPGGARAVDPPDRAAAATSSPTVSPAQPPAGPSGATDQGWAPSPSPAGRQTADHTTPRGPRDTHSGAPGADDWDRAPAPVALSAAAHVPLAAPADTEPTGMGLPADHRVTPDVIDPAHDASTPAAPRRRRLVLGLGALALVIGTSLGVAGSVLRDEDPAQTPADDGRAGNPIPELTEKPEDTNPRLDLFDPALSFELIDLRYESGNLIASWQDRSDGEAFFHISQISPETAYLWETTYGATEAAFPMQLGLGRSCFVVVMHMPDESQGSSDTDCVQNSGG